MLQKPLITFLKKNFPKENSFNLLLLTGGANNRVYLVKTKNQKYILKQFFQNKADLRPRFYSELNFLQYAWGEKIRNIPEPIYACEKQQLALLSFLSGRIPTHEDVKWDTIEQCMHFIVQLNQNKSTPLKLPPASEACFCLQDYFDTVERKIQRLQSSLEKKPKEQAFIFLQKNLVPHWEKVKSWFISNYNSFELDKKFHENDLCHTPSDLGFHNMILSKERMAYFIDFEYAGKDDIAKTFCDFFCQPKIPVPLSYLSKCKSYLIKQIPTWKNALERSLQLMPICKVKWCCIILNIYVQSEKNRRNFSGCKEEEERQLELAKHYLAETELFWIK